MNTDHSAAMVTGKRATDPAFKANGRPWDMRKWTPQQRLNVNIGPIADIVDENGKVISRMREELFMAITTKPDILVNHKILLPAEVLEPALQMFATHTNKLDGKTISGLHDPYRDMHLCFAAQALGLGLYTRHIFQDYKKKLKARQLTYDQLIGILKAQNQLARGLYTDVFHRLATLACDNQIPDYAAFDEELAANKRLADAIDTLHGIWNKAAARKAYKDMKARKKAADVQREQARAARGEKTWADRNAEETELRTRVLEKKRTGAKMTREEASMHYKMFGKQVPL